MDEVVVGISVFVVLAATAMLIEDGAYIWAAVLIIAIAMTLVIIDCKRVIDRQLPKPAKREEDRGTGRA
jgi:hypothetical protein